jgi:spectinomycin phosphotransferase
MIEKDPLLDKRIIDCLNTDYAIEVAMLTFLPLGADMNASAYKAETRSKSSYFIKLKCRHHPDISTIILDLLHNAGIQQIILPFKTHHGHSTQSIDDFTLTVFPFIRGQNGFCRGLTDDQWIMLGKVMRQIHEIDVPPPVQAMIQREIFSPKWREAVRSLLIHIELEPNKDQIALKLVTFMKKHIATIHRLIDQAEQLSQKVKDESFEFVLCHADIHGGNVLIDSNDSLYVVDWDKPMMAPKERDLMFIGGGVANVWNRPDEEKLFYEGYKKTEVNRTLLAYYRHERIIEDIALFGQQLLLTSVGSRQERVESYKHFIAQFEPQGVVEIAFNTSERI